MNLITHLKEIVNPNISHIKSAMHEVEDSPDEGFIILEKDDGTFIQGLYVKGASDIRLAGADITKEWYIEKPLGGYERYYTNLTSEEALKVFIKFCEGIDWKELTKWEFVVEKEHVLQLTSEEKESLLEMIEVMLEDLDSEAVELEPEHVKKYVQQLTDEEKESIIKEAKLSEPVSDMDLWKADFKRWMEELREDVVKRGVVGEGHIISLGGCLSGYLEGREEKSKALESIYAKCKKYDENIP
jgi:hypothetical protein